MFAKLKKKKWVVSKNHWFWYGIFAVLCAMTICQAEEMGKVFLTDGTKIEGKIMEKLRDGGFVLQKDDKAFDTVRVNQIRFITTTSVCKIGSIGAGYGIGYGILGVNLEINTFPGLALTAGLGTALFFDYAYAVGAKWYFLPSAKNWRPRISVYYGTNTLVIVDDLESGTEYAYTAVGVTTGIGIQRMWGDAKRNGIDFDLLFVVSTTATEKVETWNRFKLQTGYRFAF